MDNDDLKQYSEAFHADIATNAHALDMLREHAFVEKIADILIDFGEISNCEPCHYQARGMKDELDELRHKTDKIPKLEAQVESYKKKLG